MSGRKRNQLESPKLSQIRVAQLSTSLACLLSAALLVSTGGQLNRTALTNSANIAEGYDRIHPSRSTELLHRSVGLGSRVCSAA